MTQDWIERGEIETASVTSIAVSPGFATDHMLLVTTLAGVSVSRDGGDSWEHPARGVLGPFVRDLILSPAFATDETVHAVSPAGLFRSHDAGRGWMLAEGTRRFAGPMAVAADGTLFVVSNVDSRIWRGSGDGTTLRPAGRIDRMPLALAAGGPQPTLWLVTHEGLLESTDRGDSWHEVGLPLPVACQAAVACGPDLLAVGTEGHGFLLRGADGEWEIPEAMAGLDVTSIASNSDGSVIAAGTPVGVLVSRDAGRTWMAPVQEMAVLSLAMSPDAMQLFAGTVGEGCWRSSDMGHHWTALHGINGALVAELHASSNETIARTADNLLVRSADAGHSWKREANQLVSGIRAIAVDSTTQAFAFATPDGIVLDHDRVVSTPLGGDIQHVALAGGATGLLAVGNETEVMLSSDQGTTWAVKTPPLSAGERVVALSFGRPGGRGEYGLAVGTLDGNAHEGTVWFSSGTLPWRRVASGKAGAGGVQMAVVHGPRGIFAAVGDTIYRPARVGEILFASETIAGDGPCDVLQLAALLEPGGDVTLAALTTGGPYVSRDGGIVWDACPQPRGGPITAIALRAGDQAGELLAVQVGGVVWAQQLANM
jgi:photosystem II stability/assembly factor-like uncharacterized protein